MAFKLIWSPTAKFDLRDIAAFIADDNKTAAERFVDSAFKSVERLSDFPESGRKIPEFGDSAIREVIRKPCKIICRLNLGESIIEIARVWHSLRGDIV